MKLLLRSVSLSAAAVLLVSSASFAVSAEETKANISLRVEGVDGNIYLETVSVTDDDGSITAADALVYADKLSDKLEIKGAESGYITEVNGTAAGKFGGYDGWYYAVNNEVPSVGVNECTVKDGDSLVLYYGGYPCQIPFADLDKLSDGVIAFKSNDLVFDENWNATPVVAPVEAANVTVNGVSFTTDKNGEITLGEDITAGELSVQIDKKDASGAPAVLRFAPGYTISYAPADKGSDTDSDSDSDISSDTEKDTDKSSNKDTDSDTTSSQTSSVTNTTTTTTTTTTASTVKSTAAPTVSENTAPVPASGDGRTYLALGVFGGAIVIAVIMIILGKKKN